jgi:hypothetical protein
MSSASLDARPSCERNCKHNFIVHVHHVLEQTKANKELIKYFVPQLSHCSRFPEAPDTSRHKLNVVFLIDVQRCIQEDFVRSCAVHDIMPDVMGRHGCAFRCTFVYAAR